MVGEERHICSGVHMPRTQDPAWAAYTTAVEKSENRNGIPVTLQGWKCIFCGSAFWNRDLKRVLFHVSCDAALCSKITPCSIQKVPEAVRTAARAQLVANATTKERGEKRKAQSAGAADEADHGRAVQTRLRGKTVEKTECDNAVSDFFDGCGIPHAKVFYVLLFSNNRYRIRKNNCARFHHHRCRRRHHHHQRLDHQKPMPRPAPTPHPSSMPRATTCRPSKPAIPR